MSIVTVYVCVCPTYPGMACVLKLRVPFAASALENDLVDRRAGALLLYL